MRVSLRVRRFFWFGLYLFLILLPLWVGVVSDPFPDPRAPLLEGAVAVGYVGLSLMSLEFALISRVRSLASAFGQDALARFHKYMGLVALLFVGAHPALLLAAGFPWGLVFDPFSPGVPPAFRWGMVSFYGLLGLLGLTLGRRRLRLPYEFWQWTHAGLAVAAVGGGFFHIHGIGGYTGAGPMKVLWAFYLVFLLALTVRYRLILPLLRWRRPWEVVSVTPERGRVTTLTLRPRGHRGLSFDAGQFAWLSTTKTPFGWAQHPISFSSSAERSPGDPLAFSIKNLGNWSGKIVPRLSPGERVWLDGPHGAFSLDRCPGPGYVMVAGGIGAAPLVSMCRTLADRKDLRPVTFFYGARSWESVPFREELESLTHRMPLTVIFVLEDPPPDWAGERGYMTADLFRRRLPADKDRAVFFVCGPPPFMDAVEGVLPELGVPVEHIHTERFDLV